MSAFQSIILLYYYTVFPTIFLVEGNGLQISLSKKKKKNLQITLTVEFHEGIHYMQIDKCVYI